MADRVLIAYFTKGGATEQYAAIVADELRAQGREVEVVDLREVRSPDLSTFSTVVVGTGVRTAMVYRRAKKFLRRKDLAGKRLAIFLSSGIAVEDPERSKKRFLEPLIEKYGLSPVLCDPFPGKVPGERGKLQETTDPELARRWARRLAAELDRPAADRESSP